MTTYMDLAKAVIDQLGEDDVHSVNVGNDGDMSVHLKDPKKADSLAGTYTLSKTHDFGEPGTPGSFVTYEGSMFGMTVTLFGANEKPAPEPEPLPLADVSCSSCSCKVVL